MRNENRHATIALPERLVTPVDLARVMRELKMLDDWLNQAALRETGKTVNPPKTSATLEEIAVANGVSLLENGDRQKLITVLKVFSEHAPKIHMSFAVEPSAGFLHHMINWLRTNINPLILLDVGLQPTLAAGCTVRTVNKMFDLSLRHRFVDSRPLLVQSIAKFQAEAPQVAVIDDAVAAVPPASPAPQSQPAATSAPPATASTAPVATPSVPPATQPDPAPVAAQPTVAPVATEPVAPQEAAK